MPYYARKLPDDLVLPGTDPPKQRLEDHCLNVANSARRKLAAALTERDGDIAFLAGLHHDDGKYRGAFQDRLLRNVGSKWDGRHASVGAAKFERDWADRLRPTAKTAPIYVFTKCLSKMLSTVVANHHLELRDYTSANESSTESRIADGLKLLPEVDGLLLDLPDPTTIQPPTPPFVTKNEKGGFSLQRRLVGADGQTITRGDIHSAFAWFTRFVHSTVVDADVEDAIDFERPRYVQRIQNRTVPSFSSLYKKLETHMRGLRVQSSRTKVNKLRDQLWYECLPSADSPPGFYTLSAPVGSGKTLLSAAWALRHIQYNSMRRLIYVMPFTSIITQNADVYRQVFGKDAVVEHQSNIDPVANTFRNRQAIPNWNSPIVLTTMVQLFESLRECTNYRLRKLHSIPNSVIILDEAQVLDPSLLVPTLDTLWRLRGMGCTILFMTATQPCHGCTAGSSPVRSAVYE